MLNLPQIFHCNCWKVHQIDNVELKCLKQSFSLQFTAHHRCFIKFEMKERYNLSKAFEFFKDTMV